MTRPRRRRSPALARWWPVAVGLCLMIAGLSVVLSTRSSTRHEVQLAAEKTAVETQRDFIAHRAADFAADALSACSDDSIKSKLPANMCSTATRIVSEPVPTQIVGPPGQQGLQGVQGVPGPPGLQGEPGPAGKPGAGVVSIDFQAVGGKCFAVTLLSDGRLARSEVANQICGNSTSSPSESPSAEPTPG